MQKILIDSDTGVDDAMGILYALADPTAEIVGITTLVGNALVQHCTQNALRLVELMDAETPVVAGAATPLIEDPMPVPFIHGPEGHGGATLAPPTRTVQAGIAASYIADQVRRHGRDLTLVAVGPLTNIAMALKLHPDAFKHCGPLIWMGGAVERSGNDTATGEANSLRDPEAAEIVMRSGLDVTMVPLDVTDFVCLTDLELKALADSGTAAGRHLAEITPLYLDFYELKFNERRCAMHSALAIAIAIDPSLVTKSYRLPISVELHGMHTRGMTVVDRRTLRGPEETWRDTDDVPTRAVYGVDGDRFLSRFMKLLSNS
ncbi:nucleoside hydrolase [Streptomyces malaysiensis]|uniref:Nucleoside hydrolase n=1 Tax=Streptomyces malaysiensis subsp. samsunensis TaxID=459658 RepID=A0A9X2RVF7_STRMQ|nr:nucleoside hydrolase [Streptomyces samsunensis]MCQ8832227.1 nucleoside hydrolase [Streptomyces samsunensis]